jgi:hypothetical protein
MMIFVWVVQVLFGSPLLLYDDSYGTEAPIRV